jgi:hypothetical protein
MVDENGEVWCSTSRGVVHVDRCRDCTRLTAILERDGSRFVSCRSDGPSEAGDRSTRARSASPSR